MFYIFNSDDKHYTMLKNMELCNNDPKTSASFKEITFKKLQKAELALEEAECMVEEIKSLIEKEKQQIESVKKRKLENSSSLHFAKKSRTSPNSKYTTTSQSSLDSDEESVGSDSMSVLKGSELDLDNM